MSCSVAILGAGAGGAAAAADLALRGFEVRLWNRNRRTLEPFLRRGAVGYEGALGDGEVRPRLVTDRLGDALAGADVAVVCLPALAHEPVIAELLRQDSVPPLVLDPGHTGGALHFRATFARAGRPLPPLAELSTLTYVARKLRPDVVTVSGVAGRVWLAALPGGELALALARELFPCAAVAPDVLATDLANVNLVLHPPGAVLGAAWVEATRGDYRFYADGTTEAVTRVIAGLDEERLAVARAFGHALPGLADEMAAIGTADAAAASEGDLRRAIANGTANRAIRAPDSLEHRYYREDFAYGLVPFLALAEIAGVEAELARSLLRIGETMLQARLRRDGLDRERLGLAGVDRSGLRAMIVPNRVESEVPK